MLGEGDRAMADTEVEDQAVPGNTISCCGSYGELYCMIHGTGLLSKPQLN